MEQRFLRQELKRLENPYRARPPCCAYVIGERPQSVEYHGIKVAKSTRLTKIVQMLAVVAGFGGAIGSVPANAKSPFGRQSAQQRELAKITHIACIAILH